MFAQPQISTSGTIIAEHVTTHQGRIGDLELTACSRDPPPKKATDSACVRSLEWINLQSQSFHAQSAQPLAIPYK